VRVRLARGLIGLGALVQSLALVVMKPDDLTEFSRQTYSRPDNVDGWAEDAIVDSGLNDQEPELAEAAKAAAPGKLLLLGVGGGREAIALARMGYDLTGVDFVPQMVRRAIQNAARRGFTIQGMVQEVSRLDVPAGAYDVVWLSSSMYSCVPTRARRVGMVRRIARALKPGGLFLCQFHWRPGPQPARRGDIVRRLVAICTLGNLTYEPGDTLWFNIEFLHGFASEDAVRSELEEGGVRVTCIYTTPTGIRGSVISRKCV
jgi:SAM-dependent methyltransferase